MTTETLITWSFVAIAVVCAAIALWQLRKDKLDRDEP